MGESDEVNLTSARALLQIYAFLGVVLVVLDNKSRNVLERPLVCRYRRLERIRAQISKSCGIAEAPSILRCPVDPLRDTIRRTSGRGREAEDVEIWKWAGVGVGREPLWALVRPACPSLAGVMDCNRDWLGSAPRTTPSMTFVRAQN